MSKPINNFKQMAIAFNVIFLSNLYLEKLYNEPVLLEWFKIRIFCKKKPVRLCCDGINFVGKQN